MVGSDHFEYRGIWGVQIGGFLWHAVVLSRHGVNTKPFPPSPIPPRINFAVTFRQPDHRDTDFCVWEAAENKNKPNSFISKADYGRFGLLKGQVLTGSKHLEFTPTGQQVFFKRRFL